MDTNSNKMEPLTTNDSVLPSESDSDKSSATVDQLPPVDAPEMQMNHKFQSKKFPKKLKYIFASALLLLLVVGAAAAFFLTQTNQDLRQQAAGATYVRCQKGGFCPLGSDCNKATGICEAKQKCKSHEACPSTSLCSPQGFCEPKRFCTTSRECKGTEICPGSICVPCSKKGEGGWVSGGKDTCCPGLKLKQLDKTCNKWPKYTPCPEQRCSP